MSDNVIPAQQQVTTSPPAVLPANQPNLYDPLFADRIEGLVKPANSTSSNQPPIQPLLQPDAGKRQQPSWWYFVLVAGVLSRFFNSCNSPTDSANRVKNVPHVQPAPRLQDHKPAMERPLLNGPFQENQR